MFTDSSYLSTFPKRNRDGRVQTHDEMRKQLSKSGTNGWTYTDLLTDAQLLLYLCDFLDVEGDVKNICKSIVGKRAVDDGYQMIISSMAGLEGY